MKKKYIAVVVGIVAFVTMAEVVPFKDAAKINSWDVWNEHKKPKLPKERCCVTWTRLNQLDFGPFELANPAREARVKLGPDETPEVREAVAGMLAEVEAKTGVKVGYSTWSSPVGGDVFVSTQPWAAKGAWFVKLKNNIVAIHGSDFDGTRKAVNAFRARFIASAKGRG